MPGRKWTLASRSGGRHARPGNGAHGQFRHRSHHERSAPGARRAPGATRCSNSSAATTAMPILSWPPPVPAWRPSASPARAGVPRGRGGRHPAGPLQRPGRGAGTVFARHGADIAAIIVEPVAANMGLVPPLPGFLEGLRVLADQYGSLLIFDEVITGFRAGLRRSPGPLRR